MGGVKYIFEGSHQCQLFVGERFGYSRSAKSLRSQSEDNHFLMYIKRAKINIPTNSDNHALFTLALMGVLSPGLSSLDLALGLPLTPAKTFLHNYLVAKFSYQISPQVR